MTNMENEANAVMPAAENADDRRVCLRLPRVYDWVRLKSDQIVQADIPAADLISVLDAIAAGHALTVSVSLDLAASTVQVVSITRIDDQKACVTFRKLIVSTVTIYDETAATALSTFGKTVQLFDSSDLCYPVGLVPSDIRVAIVNGVGEALSAIPFEGQLTIAYTTCQEITVEIDIYAKVQILSYCSSREGAACRTSISCPGASAASFPAGCSGILS